MKHFKYILFALILLLKGVEGYGQYVSKNSGAWDDTNTWTLPWTSAPVPPGSGQTVIISAAHTVSGTATNAYTLNVLGTLIFDGDYTNNSGGITIADGGTMVVKGNMPSSSNITINGTGRLLVLGNLEQTGGTITINNSGILVVGKDFTENWQVVNAYNSSSILVLNNYTVSGNLTTNSSTIVAVLGSVIGSGCSTCTNTISTSSAAWIFYSQYIPTSWWDDHLANIGESDGPYPVCPASASDFSVNAVDDGNLSSTVFEWAVYGGTIADADNSSTISGHMASAKTKIGVNSYSNSTISVTWESTGFTGAYVAVRQSSANNCSDGKWSVFYVNISSETSWTGTVNTDWNNAANWSCGVIPSLTNDVQIPNVTNKPILSSGAVGTVKNITVNSGSSLTITGNTLQIAGTITSSGTFTASAGTIEMKGSTAQTISSGVFAGNTIGNLTINNSSGVTLGGALNVTGIVKATSGNLNSGGYLTLISTASQTALIDGSGSGNVFGNVTMQRYLPSGFGYKYFSSPFSTATVNEFGDDMNLAASFPTLYSYDENHKNAGSDISGWTTYTTTTNSLNPMEGYAVNFGSNSAASTADITGVVNNGTLSKSLYNHNGTYTKGFNLVGNPYPSPIDWNATTGWTKTNVDKAIYLFNAGTTDQYGGVYSSYVNGVYSDLSSNVTTTPNIIPSMQGFFVHVSDGSFPVSATLGATNAVRVNNLNPVFKDAIVESRTILRFAANLETTQPIEDGAVIYFDDQAGRNFEGDVDALKLLNTDVLVPNLYTISTDSKNLSINGMPAPGDSITTIPLGLYTFTDGWVNFKAKDITDLPADMNIYLKDASVNITQNLKLNPLYRFYLKSGEYNNRFSLLFSLSDLTYVAPVNEKMFTIVRTGYHLFAKVDLPSNTKGTLMVTNMQGQVLLRREVFEMETVEIDPNMSSGVYVVMMISGKRTQSEKILLRKDYE